MTEVTTFYLEMRLPSELNSKQKPDDFDVSEAQISQPDVNRFLYEAVGRNWAWEDKLNDSAEEWKSYVCRDQLRTWIAYHRGSIAGYYELESQPAHSVEIKYFGLMPEFIGKGFGGYLLTHAIQSAWSWKPVKRVWVHTCTLDHPMALANYEARGFSVFDRVAS